MQRVKDDRVSIRQQTDKRERHHKAADNLDRQLETIGGHKNHLTPAISLMHEPTSYDVFMENLILRAPDDLTPVVSKFVERTYQTLKNRTSTRAARVTSRFVSILNTVNAASDQEFSAMIALATKLFQQYCAMNPNKKMDAHDEIAKIEHTLDYVTRFIGQESKRPFLLMRHVNCRAYLKNPIDPNLAWNRNIYQTGSRLAG